MKVLVLGMGNPILSDDGVGLVIADRLRELISGADVVSNNMIGLSLFEQIIGYDKIFVIDAMTTPDHRIGELKKILREEKGGTRHLFSSHGLNFFELMELGAFLGYEMPEVGAVYGIEIGNVADFGERLSAGLSEKLTTITEAILDDMFSQIPSLSLNSALPSL
jgi:hydrogenase maturation protease